MEKPNFKTLCKMRIQELTNFPFIEQDFDFITNYQFLCQVIDHLNQVIENSNTQNTAITNLYNAFTTLKEYVDNYFDNLDVQEEINNKLDAMVEDGTLEEIISHYLSNVVSIEENINDNNSFDKKFKNINISSKYYKGNIYHIIHIKNISDINVVATSGNFEAPNVNPKNILDYSKINNNSVIINASPFDTTTYQPLGYQKNKNNIYTPPETPQYLYYACFDSNNDLHLIDGHVVSSINDFINYPTVCSGFKALIIDGNNVSIIDEDKTRRQVLAQLTDKSYLIISTGGRGFLQNGSTYQDLQDILSLYDVDNAISLDGGGSTQTFINNKSLLIPTDIAEINGRIIPIALTFNLLEMESDNND